MTRDPHSALLMHIGLQDTEWNLCASRTEVTEILLSTNEQFVADYNGTKVTFLLHIVYLFGVRITDNKICWK